MANTAIETRRIENEFATSLVGVPWRVRVAWLGTRALSTLTAAEIVDGGDFSYWQNNADPDKILDFQAFKDQDEREFAIVRITRGDEFVDPYWVQNVDDAMDADLPVMLYHYFKDYATGAEQAAYILAELQPHLSKWGYNVIVFLDLEEATSGINNATRTARFIELVQLLQAAGLMVGVYSSPGWWNSNMSHTAGLAAVLATLVQWVAHWTAASSPILPINWSWDRLKFWQNGISGVHSWVPATPSIVGNVDYDLFFGTVTELENLLGITTPGGPHDHPDYEAAIADLQTETQFLRTQLESLQADFSMLESRVRTNESWIQQIITKMDNVRDAWIG